MISGASERVALNAFAFTFSETFAAMPGACGWPGKV
jgi:hypothetical protein